MKKKCKVVMLPAKETTDGFYSGSQLMMASDKHDNELFLADGDVQYIEVPQHLYLISDDEIKEGDWVYSPVYKVGLIDYYEVAQPDKSYFEGYGHDFSDCKKVIASTERLVIEEIDGDNFMEVQEIFIPKIPESFIKAYVKANGQIDQVDVEYLNSRTGKAEYLEWDENGLCDEWKLKITGENEVIISYDSSPNIFDSMTDLEIANHLREWDRLYKDSDEPSGSQMLFEYLQSGGIELHDFVKIYKLIN